MASAQSIVPDGSTSTSVTNSNTNPVRVNIANPDTAGTSVNRYRHFNVPTNGVDLVNSAAKARTILNEVTSINSSVIEGPLAVVGPRADVILANPNGITINGGAFLNTGRVAVITGNSLATAPNEPLQFNVEGGQITVGTTGLAASIQQLDLVADSLRIQGKIEDARTTKELRFNATTGSATVSVDPTAPASSTLGWVSETPEKKTSQDVSLSVSDGAVISGGAIFLTANDKGAGVNVNGSQLTSAGNLVISSNGKIQSKDSELIAADNLAIEGADVSVTGESKTSTLRSKDSGVLIRSKGKVDFSGDIDIQGNTRSTFGFSALGAVSVIAEGDINIATTTRDSPHFATTRDGISLESGATISSTGARYNSARDIIISADDDLSLDNSALTATQNVTVNTDGHTSLLGSTLRTDSSALFQSGSIAVTSSQDNRTEVVARDGGILIETKGSLTNVGSLIQGRRPIDGNAQSTGGVTLNIGGKLTNRTIRESQIASIFSEGEDLQIRTQGDIDNKSGRLLSNGSINIITTNAFRNAVAKTDVAENGASASSKTSSSNSVVVRKKSQSFEFGSHLAGREIGTLTAIEKISISAKNLQNLGGEISAHTIQLNADTISNSPEMFGSKHFKKKCVFIFCSYSGSASITQDGGIIAASNQLSVTAKQSFSNIGGTLSAREKITLNAPHVMFGARLIPDYYQRPGGVGSLFSGVWGRTFYRFDGGTVVVSNGSLELKSDQSVLFDGTTLLVSEDINASSGYAVNDVPAGLRTKNNLEIGYLRYLLP